MRITRQKSQETGFTLIELLVVIAVMGLLMALLLPALSAVREAASRLDCQNRLKQMGVAAIAYQASNGYFPVGRPWPDVFLANGERAMAPPTTNYEGVRTESGHRTNLFSVHVALLTYLEMQSVADMMNFDATSPIRLTNNPNATAYTMAAGAFICPSDRVGRTTVGENNYRYNFGGDTPYSGWRSVRSLAGETQGIPDPTSKKTVPLAPEQYFHGRSMQGNGAFTIRRGLTGNDFIDGLANTVFFSERDKGTANGTPSGQRLPDRTVIVSRPNGEDMDNREIPVSPAELFSACENYPARRDPFNFFSAGRFEIGSNYANGWPFAAYTSTMYNHVAPPNWKGFDCGNSSSIPDVPGEHAIISARSSHPGIVNVCFGDGHVEAVSDSIDTDIWRAMGTRNGGEAVRSVE